MHQNSEGKNKEAQLQKVAFYLPQFYRTRVNDRNWHPGFTDWLNVVRARPRFKGHHQPQIPTELGFYDQSSQDVVDKQVLLAKEGSLTAFCVYHYWFNNSPILEKPLLNIRKSCEKLDFQFCMSWANENWTRSWDGSVRKVILKQDYTAYSLRSHIEFLKPFFLSSAYLRVDSLPFFTIYRPNDIPELRRFMLEFRSRLEDAIFSKVHLCATQTAHSLLGEDELEVNGFDSCLLFEPNPIGLKSMKGNSINGSYNRYKYTELKELSLKRFRDFKFKKYGCVIPSWDNTARREYEATIIQNLNPSEYGDWLARLSDEAGKKRGGYKDLLFINAWNEWAEGCHLEPDLLNGNSFLEQTKIQASTSKPDIEANYTATSSNQSKPSIIEKQYRESPNIWLEGTDVSATELIVAANTRFIIWGGGLAAKKFLQDQNTIHGRTIGFTQTSLPSKGRLLGLNFITPEECIEGVQKSGGSKVILIASQHAEEISNFLSKHRLKSQKHFQVVSELTSVFRTSTHFCFTETYKCYSCGFKNTGSLFQGTDVRCSFCGADELVNSILHELQRDRASIERLYTWKWGGSQKENKAKTRGQGSLNFNIFTKRDVTNFLNSNLVNYVNFVASEDVAGVHKLSMNSHNIMAMDVEFVKENGEQWFRQLTVERRPGAIALWIFGETPSLIKVYGYICASDIKSSITCELGGARRIFGSRQAFQILKLTSLY